MSCAVTPQAISSEDSFHEQQHEFRVRLSSQAMTLNDCFRGLAGRSPESVASGLDRGPRRAAKEWQFWFERSKTLPEGSAGRPSVVALDCSGRQCPLPFPRTAQVVRALASCFLRLHRGRQAGRQERVSSDSSRGQCAGAVQCRAAGPVGTAHGSKLHQGFGNGSSTGTFQARLLR